MSAACRAVLRSKTAVTSTEISPLPHKILHSQAFAGAPFEIRTGGCKDKCTEYAAVAHLVERHLAKVEVASSSLVGRSNTKPSLMQKCKSDGFFVLCGNGRKCPQRRASVESGAATAVFRHDPSCEKRRSGTPAGVPLLRNLEYIFRRLCPEQMRRAFQIILLTI